MPKTINKGLFKKSQAVKYTKKGGKYIASSDDVTDEQRLASNLGVSYSGKNPNLEDLIDNRLSALGISLEFSRETTRLENAQLGETTAAESLSIDSAFSLKTEKGSQKSSSLNKLNKDNISTMSKTISANRGPTTRTSSAPTGLPGNEAQRTRLLAGDTTSQEDAAMEQAPTTGRY